LQKYSQTPFETSSRSTDDKECTNKSTADGCKGLPCTP
jgi:hypothetical protein